MSTKTYTIGGRLRQAIEAAGASAEFDAGVKALAEARASARAGVQGYATMDQATQEQAANFREPHRIYGDNL